ncbi:MAG: hypothetical protein WA786_05690 [Acidimicrobiales bacterium]
MASEPSTWIPRNKNTLYLIVIVYTFAALMTLGWLPGLGWALIVVGIASALYVVLRYRPSTGPFSISTDCARCGAPLAQRAGMPASTCSSCGDTQPWAKALRREDE